MKWRAYTRRKKQNYGAHQIEIGVRRRWLLVPYSHVPVSRFQLTASYGNYTNVDSAISEGLSEARLKARLLNNL